MSILRFLLNIALAVSLASIFTTGVLAQESKVIGSPSPEVEPVNSYELFWPIVAGKVMGDQLYFLKSLKEVLREALIFSDLKKAEYNMTLSEKRVIEAEKLFAVKKDYKNGRLSLDEAQQKREKAVEFLKKAEEKGRNVIEQENRIISSLERQRALLIYLATQFSEEPKKVIEDNTAQLNSTLAILQ